MHSYSEPSEDIFFTYIETFAHATCRAPSCSRASLGVTVDHACPDGERRKKSQHNWKKNVIKKVKCQS